MAEVGVSCRCGAVKARLVPAGPLQGTRVTCYCKDCQAFARHLGAEGRGLDAPGGTDIYQTLPVHVQIVEGAEYLRALRLSPKGLVRWYAGCCNTPLANTLPSPKLAFVGVLAANADDPGALGPTRAVVNTGGASPGPKIKDYGFARAGVNILKRHVTALLSSKRGSPFFDADGQPIVTPTVLTLQQRRAATPD